MEWLDAVGGEFFGLGGERGGDPQEDREDDGEQGDERTAHVDSGVRAGDAADRDE